MSNDTGAVAAIIGLLLGGLLYTSLQAWLFVVSAVPAFAVGIMAWWSRRQST